MANLRDRSTLRIVNESIADRSYAWSRTLDLMTVQLQRHAEGPGGRDRGLSEKVGHRFATCVADTSAAEVLDWPKLDHLSECLCDIPVECHEWSEKALCDPGWQICTTWHEP